DAASSRRSPPSLRGRHAPPSLISRHAQRLEPVACRRSEQRLPMAPAPATLAGVHPDALVFDLDGTLWDTTATCADAWNPVLARLGIAYRRITAADVRAVTGQPHVDGIRRAFPDLGAEDVGRVAAETATEDTVAIAAHGGVLYPGVREHLPTL